MASRTDCLAVFPARRHEQQARGFVIGALVMQPSNEAQIVILFLLKKHHQCEPARTSDARVS